MFDRATVQPRRVTKTKGDSIEYRWLDEKEKSIVKKKKH